MVREQLLIEQIHKVDGIAPGNGLAKHLKMASSPFVFFRGSSQLFYADLAAGNLLLPKALTNLPLTTIMGDCHTSNFGFLTEEGSHGDDVIFSANDFDDACIGHAGWDMLRYAVSLLLCAEHCHLVSEGKLEADEQLFGEPSVSEDDAVEAIKAFLHGYEQVCQQGLIGENHIQNTVENVASPLSLKKKQRKAQKRAAGGKQFSIKSALAKAVDTEHFPLKFRQQKAKLKPLPDSEYQALADYFAPYMDDEVLDICERLNAGTGSHNMRRYYALVGPAGINNPDQLSQCHIVEVKQQRAAAPLYYFPDLSVNNRLNPAHLTVMCQRRMQRRPDLVLDEVEWQGSHWLVRSRHHAKVGIDPEDIAIGEENLAGGFSEYAQLCGQALALAHCRGDRRSLQFEQAVCDHLQDATPGLIHAAKGYARQVAQDCLWLAEQEGLV